MYQQISKLKVFDSQVNMTDIAGYEDFFATPWMKPEMLTDTMVWLQPNQWKHEFLLHTLTINNAIMRGVNGAGDGSPSSSRKLAVGTEDYEWLVMGAMKNTEKISFNPYQTGDKPGINGQEFSLTFRSPLFKKGYTIESKGTSSALKYRVRIVSNAEPVADGFRYKVVYRGKTGTSFLPLTEVQQGVEWAEFWADTNLQASQVPGEGNRIVPGKATNQLNTLISTRSIKGNTGNMALTIQVPVGEDKMSYNFLEQDAWMQEYRWMRAKETIGLYGEYNKNVSTGIINLSETNPEGFETVPIREGSGILEQIPNVAMYNRLSYEFLETLIMDIFFSYPGKVGKSVTLMTGQGGMKEFDRAMKDYLTAQYAGSFWRSNDKIVSGVGQEMEVNGYIKKVYFINGYSVEVIHNQSFDIGMRAQIDNRHPETGLPMESYRMVFMDTDNSGADVSLRYVYQRGIEVQEWENPGMSVSSPLWNSKYPDLTTGNQPVSQKIRKGTCGWVLLNAATSLHLMCNAS
jgi:hypothetical protein